LTFSFCSRLDSSVGLTNDGTCVEKRIVACALESFAGYLTACLNAL